ncbi:MAG: hypothetical protein GX330_00145, partial [Bacteroidales bacterium]|nr:hypothetical protein [Bacteroidales bacterium]
MAKIKKTLHKVGSMANINLNKDYEHVWQFSRVGGVNRVNLESGKDLVYLDQLDQKLWTALSCPIEGLEIDRKTLELIDNDKDGKIRAPEILSAVKWMTSMLNSPDDLLQSKDGFPLSAINTDTEEGQNLLNSAKQILINLGTPEKEELTVEETSDTDKIFAETKYNGDGVITPISTDDDTIKQLIENIIKHIGSVPDLNTQDGINGEHVEEFYKQCTAYSEWQHKADEHILPFGETTADAYQAMTAIKSKMEDYFLRCHIANYDEKSIETLNDLHETYQELSKENLSEKVEKIASFPLANIDKNGILFLDKNINPAWKNDLDKFVSLVVSPKEATKKSINEADWKAYIELFKPYEDWLTEKPENTIDALGIDYINETLNNDSKSTLLSLIEEDLALETNTKNIILVDKFSRYYRDLYVLLKNYVTFYDFYAPEEKAIFQCGELYIDQRRCDLCIQINDMDKHNIIAKTSGICLIYCECTARTKKEKMTIVAALTDGNFDNIEEGRNALFYDREGNDWDATIIKVVDNPISISQAFWSPYRKFSRFITKQVEAFASKKEQEIDATSSSKIESISAKADEGLSTAVTTPVAAAPAQAPATPPPPFDIGKFVGIFAALSLAFGAIGSIIASFLTGFFKLTWWQMPLAILGIILCISGPS